VSVKREIVGEMMAHGLSERAACRVVGLSRSSRRYPPRDQAERQRLRAEVRALAQQHRRYGYRRVTALLRRRGERVNHKRVWAIWQAERLGLPRHRPRKRRAAACRRPTCATHRTHVWSYDFLFDRTERGQTLDGWYFAPERQAQLRGKYPSSAGQCLPKVAAAATLSGSYPLLPSGSVGSKFGT
jgi:putative transposase